MDLGREKKKLWNKEDRGKKKIRHGRRIGKEGLNGGKDEKRGKGGGEEEKVCEKKEKEEKKKKGSEEGK